MRLSDRNKQPVYYALYQGKQSTVDANGLYTGENVPVYSTPALADMVVGLNSGSALLEQFGISDSYSVKLATDDTDLAISTSSVLWLGLGTIGAYASGRSYGEGDLAIKDGTIKRLKNGAWAEVPYTHAVVRVSKSFGYITYLVKEVSVS